MALCEAADLAATWGRWWRLECSAADLLLTVGVSAVCFLGVMGLGLGPSVLGRGYLGSVIFGQFYCFIFLYLFMWARA
ncbi:hypothetical protein ES288_D07G166300v1 [Gossypium darwinii]|uniref:Uncharacterized protein n=1 Tax=Gossypium darwinii TaxID=34276 RepID=A0A5D2BWE7_GOSDA|nr:hypothetical protein ES288_D07G166300v1 [Gossypium darwinii]